MKTLLTVTRNGDTIRISRVTAHGEEVIEPDAESKALGVLLWSRLAQGDPQGGVQLLPWDAIGGRLDRLTAAVERLTVQTEKHAHAMAQFQVAAQAATKPTPVQRGQ